jgi:hypothetical protein
MQEEGHEELRPNFALGSLDCENRWRKRVKRGATGAIRLANGHNENFLIFISILLRIYKIIWIPLDVLQNYTYAAI